MMPRFNALLSREHYPLNLQNCLIQGAIPLFACWARISSGLLSGCALWKSRFHGLPMFYVVLKSLVITWTGFDVCLARGLTDGEIVAVAQKEQRIVLTRLYFHHFLVCPGCDQIFWKGSHYEAVRHRFQAAGILKIR
jgi:hypothetical protein